MKTNYFVRTALSITLLCLSHMSMAQATCSTAATVLPGCGIQGDLQNAANTGPAGGCVTTPTSAFGVWYRFTAGSAAHTITISALGNNLTAATTYIEAFSGTCGALTRIQNCQTVATVLNLTGLTIGTDYFVRIYVTSAPTTNRRGFTISLSGPLANDICTFATPITSATTCTNVNGTLAGATASNPVVASTCAGTPGADVWFQFVAQSPYPTISVSNRGANFGTAFVQLVSGNCGALNSLACATGTTATVSINTINTLNAPLTVGTTYFIRVYTTTLTPAAACGWTFNLCVTDPVPADIDYSRSYINVTKGSTGGTVDVGDTLEMRATFVITSRTADSLSFADTLFSGRGLRLVPGSIALRTNEGKVYGNTSGTGVPSPFTDAFDNDAGWYSRNNTDTIIRINFGTGATSFRRGALSNTSRPSVFNHTSIVMATYRVVVYAPYNTLINYRTGSLTYRDPAINPAGIVNQVTFGTSNLVVYQSPGLCPNSVSASNALGEEFNGTFGFPGTAAPLQRNRGTSLYTTYKYSPFGHIPATNAGLGPQDFNYAIANNTSARYTTQNTWNKPDINRYRLFEQWDIIGDHTGATNITQGNPACDTTRPISATNPCGYMLVINSAYKADTAFQYTASNLCPNTYYEISAWLRNICYKCGCDSTGTGSGSLNYIPTSLNDSSGVRPNLAFDVNGADYYTTGDIRYFGTTPTGSDATNRWVKRGFTYLTGPTETSFTLTIRNNAPGGGGNDWAMDDISIATCLPNMSYSPTLTPVVCQNNIVEIFDTVKTYFNNYRHFQWQRSTDGGATWMDIAGTTGTATPVWNGSEWQYVTSYTIPTTQTNTSNNGDRYRVTVATTAANVSNTDCMFSDGISIVNLSVNNCTVLKTDLLSFNGKLVNNRTHLNWTLSGIDEALSFVVEKSSNGTNYTTIGIVQASNSKSFSFIDSAYHTGKAWYRIALVDKGTRIKYSRNLLLNSTTEEFAVTNVVNPFVQQLQFDVVCSKDAKIDALLMTAAGNVLTKQTFTAYNGGNSFKIQLPSTLPNGLYILQVSNGEETITKKLMKK